MFKPLVTGKYFLLFSMLLSSVKHMSTQPIHIKPR